MKAEERKELVTNTLADKMGKFVQKVKGGPSRRTLFWVVLLAVVGLGVFFYFRYKGLEREEEGRGWSHLGSAATAHPVRRYKFIQDLAKAKDFATKKPGMTATAILQTYDGQRALTLAVKKASVAERLPQGPSITGLSMLGVLDKNYDILEKEWKNDPVLQAQMAYARSVVTETRALLDKVSAEAPKAWQVLDPDGLRKKSFLEAAKGYYEHVATEYADLPQGLMAKEHLEKLNNSTEFAKIRLFYANLAAGLGINEEQITRLDRELRFKEALPKFAPE